MTWLKLDDGWTTHPKILSVSVDAGWFWLHCATYAAKHETDGFLSGGALTAMRGVSRIRTPLAKIMVELLRAGLLDTIDGGYTVHDFTDWNPSKDTVTHARAAGRERQSTSRDKRRSNAVTDGVTSRDPTRPDPTLSVNTSTTTSPSYPDEVVVVLNAILETEYADQNPSAITRPDAWRAKVYGRIRDKWGPLLTHAFNDTPSAGRTLYDLACQVFLESEDHDLRYQILTRIADMELPCIPSKLTDSAPGSKPSGQPDDGPDPLSTSGAAASSTTTTTSPSEHSTASVTDIASSRRSRSGGKHSPPSSVASTTPRPDPHGPGRRTTDAPLSPPSSPVSAVAATPSVATSLGTKYAQTGRPRHELEELMQGSPDNEIVEALAAWVAGIPERRRANDGNTYQIDHVRDDGQVFTVKVARNGFVTGMRADFPAEAWSDCEVVQPS